MSRLSKVFLLSMGVLFALACSLITNPINKVKNTAGTAEAFATNAVEFVTEIGPLGTAIANPSLIPDVGNFFNPQGSPVSEWNGIPIMSQATAGQEFDQYNYGFKFSGTVKEASDFYKDELVKQGWTSTFTMEATDQGGTLSFSKDEHILTVTMLSVEAGTVSVLLTYA